ncbi:hypothetical protein HU200_016573 [Digitaria exilis]|uniref:Uncharacterized protein n=1 Tax=Digitaria exilis TaxID=1010633 RepID=A0A835F7D7_9POAL|nr:hypothetical protein HU200_016573 [Digitaria exilis]
MLKTDQCGETHRSAAIAEAANLLFHARCFHPSSPSLKPYEAQSEGPPTHSVVSSRGTEPIGHYAQKYHTEPVGHSAWKELFGSGEHRFIRWYKKKGHRTILRDPPTEFVERPPVLMQGRRGPWRLAEALPSGGGEKHPGRDERRPTCVWGSPVRDAIAVIARNGTSNARASLGSSVGARQEQVIDLRNGRLRSPTNYLLPCIVIPHNIRMESDRDSQRALVFHTTHVQNDGVVPTASTTSTGAHPTNQLATVTACAPSRWGSARRPPDRMAPAACALAALPGALAAVADWELRCWPPALGGLAAGGQGQLATQGLGCGGVDSSRAGVELDYIKKGILLPSPPLSTSHLLDHLTASLANALVDYYPIVVRLATNHRYMSSQIQDYPDDTHSLRYLTAGSPDDAAAANTKLHATTPLLPLLPLSLLAAYFLLQASPMYFGLGRTSLPACPQAGAMGNSVFRVCSSSQVAIDLVDIDVDQELQ